jgi:two-component system NtrC family sensor kinase
MRAFVYASTIVVVAISAFFVVRTGLSSAENKDNLAVVTRNYAGAIDQLVSGSIDKIDLIVLAVADELQGELAAKDKIDIAAIDKWIARNGSRIPELDGLRVADQTGRLIAGTGVTGGGPASYNDRDFFAEHRSKTDRGLIISTPLFGRVSHKWFIVLTRRFNRPDGSFAGVVAATIFLDYFTELLSKFDLGPGGIAFIRDADLGLVTRFPPIEGGAVGDRGVSREFADQVKSGNAKGTFQDVAGGIERTNSYRVLSRAPFIVLVGMTRDR